MLEDTHRRWQAVETVHDIVSAMRSIAAGRIQGAQRTLEAARHYEEVVWRGLGMLPPDALRIPERDPHLPVVLVVMMSEQPFCGTFNQDLLAVTEKRWREIHLRNEVQVLAVGQRGFNLISAAGLNPDVTIPAAASLHGLRDLVKSLASSVVRQYANGEVREVRVFFNQYQSVTEHVTTEICVLPPDLTTLIASTDCQSTALRYLADVDLLAGLISELAFVTLYRAAAESFASEQAARLVAMDGATRNSEKLASDLKDLERRERQGEITRQVLELISGRIVSE